MATSLEKTSGIERKLTITIPFEQIDNKIASRLKEITQKAKMPGFRAGKVPFDVIEKKYKDPVRKEVAMDAIKETLAEALKKENLNPVAMPHIDIISANPTESLVYTATFEIFPEFTPADMTEINGEKIITQISEEDIDETVENLRKRFAKWKEITDSTRTIQNGDKIVVDFKIDIDTNPPKTENEKNVDFVIGSGSMWVDFEKPLLGKKLGDEVKFSLTFPDTHIEKDLVGKTGNFTVQIQKLFELDLPALDDAFVKKASPKVKDLKELRANLKKNMERELEKNILQKFKSSISAKLLELNPIEVPKAFIEEEIRRRQNNAKQYFKRLGVEKDIPTLAREELEKPARETIALEIILTKIGEVNNIKVAPEKLRAKIDDFASSYPNPNEVINWYYSDPKHLAPIEHEILEDEILRFLLTKVKLQEKQVSFKEAMQN